MLALQAGAHGAVEDENFLFESVEVAAVGIDTLHNFSKSFVYE
jgi:hypothetical protein